MFLRQKILMTKDKTLWKHFVEAESQYVKLNVTVLKCTVAWQELKTMWRSNPIRAYFDFVTYVHKSLFIRWKQAKEHCIKLAEKIISHGLLDMGTFMIFLP